MNTYSKVLYYKEYTAPIAYGYDEKHKVKSYVKIAAHFDFKEFLRFSVQVPNFSYCTHNPFKAILRVLEHESIGMSKYQRMKEDIRYFEKWKSMDVHPKYDVNDVN